MKCAITRGDPPLTGLLVFVFLLHYSLMGQSFSVQRVMPPPPEFFCIYTQNQDTIYAGGEKGTILKTTNRGLRWIKQNSPSAQTLRKIYFLNDTTGYIVGDNSNIIHTTNSGATWSMRTSPVAGLKFYGIHFADQNTGYITGSGGHIIKTTDGGFSWFKVGWPADADFHGIAFTDSLTGYIMTASGECYKTTDGGVNWILKHTGIFSTYYDIHLINNSLIFLTGTGGSLVRSSDAGETWQIISNGAQAVLRGITFSDSLNGFLCGDAGTLLRTTDGGVNWVQIQTSLTIRFNDIHSSAAGEVYIAAEKGKILRYNSSSGLSEYEYAKPDHFYAAKVLGRNLLHAAGAKGAIYISPNGTTWINKTIGMSGDLRSMDFLGESQGWICGDSGVIVRTVNGGSTWSPISSGTTTNLRGITEAGNNCAIAVGENGVILYTGNGGASWVTHNSGTINRLNAVDFVDSLYGIAVGDGGTVLITSNRGAQWSQISLPFTDNLFTVEFGNQNLCAAAGDNGRIIWSTDKGVTWLVNPPDNNKPYRGLSFASLNNIIFVALSRNPEKRSWGSTIGDEIFEISNNQYTLHAIDMYDDNIGIIAANDGNIFRRNYNPGIPVELVSFSAASSSGGITLEWETATETNNHGFELQRFSESAVWEKITFIPGNGSRVTPSRYIYTDTSPLQGLNRYRLMQIDYDGSALVAAETEASFFSDGSYHLGQNYPNPFNPETKISYSIAEPGHVSIVLYNALGCQTLVLVNEERPAGASEITLNAAGLASGVYYYIMTSEGFTQYRKLVVVK